MPNSVFCETLKIKHYIFKSSVSVLLPAFQSQPFICETLNSLNDQSFKHFSLYISVDKSDDDTALVVKQWCDGHKNIHSRVFCQKHRLGWVKNTNFLLKKCRTKYFMILPHDDLLDRTYIEKMFQCLQMNKHACTAFSDIKGFGKIDTLIAQNSITGERLDRIKLL